ncbi:hypothetical protein X975_22230, partial [Stegodyphus mimosarum]
MIVLSWLQKEPYQLKTFVANQVATIQDLTNGYQWRHGSSNENPGDLISRGLDPSKLLGNDMWWKGPLFLGNNEYPNKEIPVHVIVKELKIPSDS